jgi:pimeloyl-ACP methyl ester carboxylesterase
MPHFVTDDDVKLVYDDLGPQDGIPVVLCHGLASSAEQHVADANYFAQRGYRVLAPDIRGHGRSGRPSRMTAAAFTIPRMANDLAQLLDHTGVGPVHWVGNSLGGILGLQLLGRSEGRFKTFATFGTPYSLGLPRLAAHAIQWTHATLGAPLYARMAARGMSRDPATRRLIARVVETWDPRVGLLAGYNLASYDLTSNAIAARLPILMLRGGLDPQVNIFLGPTLRAMRERPNFTLVDVPGGGHCANLDATAEVRQALLRFWQRADER